MQRDSEQLVQVRHEVEQFRLALSLLQQKHRQLEQLLQQTTLDRNELQIARQAAEELVQRHVHQIQLLEQQLGELRAAAQRDQVLNQELRRNRADGQIQIDTLTEDLRVARATQERSLARIAQLERELGDETQARLQAVDRARTLDAQLRDVRSDLDAQIESLQRRLQTSEARQVQLEAENARLTEENERLRREISALRIQVAYWRNKARQNQHRAAEMAPQINMEPQLLAWLNQLSQTVSPARIEPVEDDDAKEPSEEEDGLSVAAGPLPDPEPIMPPFLFRDDRGGRGPIYRPPRGPSRGPGSSPRPPSQSSGPGEWPFNSFPTNGPGSTRPYQGPFPSGTFGPRMPNFAGRGTPMAEAVSRAIKRLLGRL